jgi:hypothetical protein
MKLHIKKYGIITFALAAAMSFTACTGDLDVTPIDPNLNTPENSLTNEAAYTALLAKCYSALAVSSPDGSSGDPDISGIDGGFGQYLRAYYNVQELPTDEAVIGWNDQTIKNFHALCWNSSDVFVTAMYYRVIYEVTLCNEVIRRINNSGSTLTDAAKSQLSAEARCLRALAYLHAIDLYGNVPFTDENTQLGGDNPKQISRTELFNWLVTEIDGDNGFAKSLPDAPENYRCGKGLAYMIMAKLYLNAKVYTGTAMYDKCADYCKKVIALGYKLESTSDYFNMFNASNNEFQGVGHEIIFSVYQDAVNTQAYGGTTYIVNAECGGKMEYASLGLGGNGWGGLRVTPQFVNKFSTSDIRGSKFFTTGQDKEIKDLGTFSEGYAYMKFTNLYKDGTGVNTSFVSADFPVYRLADVYLMLAECQVVGGKSINIDGHDGIWFFNQVRERANAADLTNVTANDILDERSRELSWECHRRSDLVRFNKLTTSDYIWAWKGSLSNADGNSVDSKYNLYPIPANDLTANPNLTQNTGY